MDCIFMDFGLEKRLLGGTSAWTKIEKTNRVGGEGLLNHYTVNRCCFQLFVLITVHKLDNEICLVEYRSDKRSLFIKASDS